MVVSEVIYSTNYTVTINWNNNKRKFQIIWFLCPFRTRLTAPSCSTLNVVESEHTSGKHHVTCQSCLVYCNSDSNWQPYTHSKDSVGSSDLKYSEKQILMTIIIQRNEYTKGKNILHAHTVKTFQIQTQTWNPNLNSEFLDLNVNHLSLYLCNTVHSVPLTVTSFYPVLTQLMQLG